jgi:hypothetical protein
VDGMMLSLKEILARRPKLAGKPTERVRFHRVVGDKSDLHVPAFGTPDWAETRCDARKHHSSLAGRATSAVNRA